MSWGWELPLLGRGPGWKPEILAGILGSGKHIEAR